MNSDIIAAKIAQPWRLDPTIRPKTLVSDAGMIRIMNIRKKFVIVFEFSNGCAALTL